jgi:acyl carrier protein
MTSSVSTQIAQPTQAAYCAANSFQDHFARYRRSIGLPGTTIAFGLIHEVGELGRRIDVQNSMSRNGLYGTTESGFLQLLDAAFLPDLSMERGNHDCLSTAHTVTSLEPALLLKKKIMNDNSGITTQPRWHHDMRFSHILRQMANLVSNSSKSVGNNDPSAAVTVLPAVEVDDLMRKGRRDEAKRAVVVSIIGRVADMLFASSDSIEPSLSVSAYGIDSLVAAELRSWFIATYSCAIPFLELLDTKTSMHDLADLVLAKSEIDGEKIGVESA